MWKRILKDNFYKMLITIIFVRKRWLLWSCLFYFLSASACIGQVLVKDKAKIKGLGVVKGVVLQYDATGNFIFVTTAGDTLVVPSTRVLNTKIINSLHLSEKGSFWHSAEFGLNWGRSNTMSPVYPTLLLETNHAYVINRYLQPGIGVGYQVREDLHIMPVFACLTGELLAQKVTPFYFSNFGYGNAWQRTYGGDFQQYEDVKGGVLWDIGGGLKIAGRNHGFYLKLGYKTQKVRLDETTWWGWSGGREIIHRTYRRFYTGLSWAF